MREILFRGKNQDNKWVEGSLVHRSLFYGAPANEYFVLTGGEFHLDFHDTVWVDLATVGQYTGLTDKNGVKVFEGDIVYAETLNTKGRYQVKFEFGQFCIGINMPVAYIRDSCEVVGNIHDNPELLTCRDKG